MYTSERFLVTLRRTLVSDDMELYATKGEIARELGTCSATIDRAVSQLKRNSLVSVRPITDQHCAAIGNSYRLTERGIQAALAIEARIIEEEDK